MREWLFFSVVMTLSLWLLPKSWVGEDALKKEAHRSVEDLLEDRAKEDGAEGAHEKRRDRRRT